MQDDPATPGARALSTAFRALTLLRPLLLVLALVLALVLPGLTGVLAPPRAAAQEPAALVRITMTGFSPSVPKPGDTVRMTGTVTNTSGKPLHRPSAYAWRDTFPLTSSADLNTALDSASNDPIGSRVFDFNKYDELFSADHPDLAPGASASFRLSVTTTELIGANPTNGVYLMGVQVLTPQSDSAIGRSRLLIPVVNPHLSSGRASAVRMSSLVLLASRPSLVRPAVLADDHLAAEVRPGGRLDGLLQAADQPEVSFAVDPNLIAELRTMAAGYQVQGPDGQLVAGGGRSVAADWLRRFSRLLTDHDGFRLPYAQYDLPALVHDDRLQVARDGEQAAGGVADVGSLPLLVVPTGGSADQATLDAARQLGARAVVLDQSNVGGLGPVLRQPHGDTVLSVDTDSSTGGPGPAPDTTPVHLRESALAASYIEALTARPGVTLGRLRLVSEPNQSSGDVTPNSAPWLQLSDVSELLDSNPLNWSDKPSYGEDDRKAELSAAQLRQLDGLSEDLHTYQELLADGRAVGPERDQSLARVASATWRRRSGAQQDFVADQRARFDQVLRGTAIHLEAKDLVLTGNAGNVPLTLVNSYDRAVRVRIDFNSPNQQRLSIADVPATKIGVVEPGARVPITATVRARAPGKLPIQCRILTVDGNPVGEIRTIEVNPTQAGRIGWLISLGAALVLVGATAFRIRQVRRERSVDETTTT